MLRKQRLEILSKLAQQQPARPTATPAPVVKSPAASTLMPTLTAGWSNRTNFVNSLVSKIDTAIGNGTKGKYNFEKLFNNSFPPGVDSEFTSPVKDMISFGRKLFAQLLNNKNPFKVALSNAEIRQRLAGIQAAPELSVFNQINAAGPIGQAKVSLATIQQDINNILNSLVGP